MRIRQVKPAFWSDARLAELPERTRLFYIGLWMIADDAGWFRWDPVEAARDLYGYEPRHTRERRVAAMFGSLTLTKRVVLHPCGHGEIPTLTTHQHLSVTTKQVKTFLREHANCADSPQIPADTRGAPPLPASNSGNGNGNGSGNGTVSKGKGKGIAPASAPIGAGATTDEAHLPPHLRIVNVS